MREQVLPIGIHESTLDGPLMQPTTQMLFSHRPDESRNARSKEMDAASDLLLYVFEDLPDHERSALLQNVRAGLHGDKGKERAKLINILFKTPNSSQFSQDIDSMQVDRIPDLLVNDGIFSLTSVMLQQRDRFNLQLGIIFSQISLDKVPDEYRKQLKPHKTELELNLETSYESWHLCSTAEEKLDRAIDEQAVMALGEKDDPLFLLKFNGKLSGLCIKDVVTKDGQVFIAGNWYSPTGVDTREGFRKAFDKGRGRVSLEGDWALMRPYKSIVGDALEVSVDIARRLALNIPEEYEDPDKQIKSDDASWERSVYRRAYEESES